MNLNLNPAPRGIKHLALAWAVIAALGAQAQTPPAPAGQRAERNSASQRYEVNQTFDGRAFHKDNNIWVYTQAFADLFGMPAQYVEGVQGIDAAAFRIEDTSYQECGFGGQANACRKVQQCLLDLYFDESKTPLPWASDAKSQWLPWYSSMRWLRPTDPREMPQGVLAIEPDTTVIRDAGIKGQIVAFADPVSRQEATFTSNARIATGDSEAISDGMGVVGFTRGFYRNLSVVNLQFGCSTVARQDVHVRLDAKTNGPFGKPVARFNKVFLPSAFVQRVNEKLKSNSDKNEVFYRSLFPPPMGTKGTNNETQE